MPFLTAGDPNLEATAAVVRALIERAQRHDVPLLFEIGFPYSDPIADGATIQASYTRALDRGVRIADVFSLVTDLRRETEVPLVAMVSYSLVFKNGIDSFLGRAQAAGFDGAIIPDLPIEEASDVQSLASTRDFKIVQLIAPTTPDERALRIAQASTGFIYYISVAGITGERERLPEELPQRVAWLRKQTDLPVCIGFGISRPEHVAMLRPVADGVIVGSALVRRLAGLDATDPAAIAGIADFVSTLLAPLQPSP